MPVDFNLLNSDQLPMKVKPFEPIDAVGNMEARYTLAGKATDVNEKIRAQKEAEADRAVLSEAMKTPDFSLATPDGAAKSVESLKGRVSPGMFMNLENHVNSLRTADVKMKEATSRMTTEAVAAKAAQTAQGVEGLLQLEARYADTAKSKGQVQADADFEQAKQQLAQQQQGNPEFVANLANINPRNLHDSIAASKHGADHYARTAQTRLEEEKAKALADPQKWKAYVGTDGANYEANIATNMWRQVNPDGTRTEVPGGAPPGVVAVGSAQQQKAAALKEADQYKLNPEQSAWYAGWAQSYGKPLPGIPAGAGNTAARMHYIQSYTQLAIDKGYSPEEAATKNLERDASRLALANLKKQNTNLVMSETELSTLFKNMQAEVDKIGGVQSPALRSAWNTAMTQFVGSDKFSELNIDSAAATEIIGRVASNNTGAAGTAVNFLKLAQGMINGNMNADQVKAANSAFEKLVKARHEGVTAAEKQLLEAGRMDAKPGSKAAEGASDDSKVSPATQADRDKDRVKIVRDEYDKAVAAVKSAPTPEARERALGDARASRAELKRLKVDVPEPGVSIAGPKEVTSKSGKKFTVTVE
jgi:hypothetical protein